VTDSYPVLFGRALAQALDDAGVGLYKSSATYTAAETASLPGIILGGPDFPTSFDNCIVLNELDPIIDGRADITWRYQILSRVKGTKVQAKNLAWSIFTTLDHKQNVPAGFRVSWVWQVSQLTFTPDTQGRPSTAQSFYFRGRRPLA
jgi:hypothetical protein